MKMQGACFVREIGFGGSLLRAGNLWCGPFGRIFGGKMARFLFGAVGFGQDSARRPRPGGLAGRGRARARVTVLRTARGRESCMRAVLCGLPVAGPPLTCA